jgi:hypothetical protein
MVELLSSVSFRTSTSPVPFVLHINECSLATVSKQLLALDSIFSHNSSSSRGRSLIVMGTSFVLYTRSPLFTNNGTFYKVFPRSYIVIGGIGSFEIS